MAAVCCKSRFRWTLEDDGKFKPSCKVGTVAAVILSLVALSVSIVMLSSHLTDQENTANSNVKMSTQQTPRSSTTEGYNNTLLSNATADCPLDTDFNFYSSENATYCLKISTSAETQVRAKAFCEQNGAHLVLVENRELYDVLVSLMKSLNIDQLWVDGIDDWQAGVYRSWKGEVLPWIPPGSRIANGLEECIRMSSRFNYRFADASCDQQSKYFFRYACQIDV